MVKNAKNVKNPGLIIIVNLDNIVNLIGIYIINKKSSKFFFYFKGIITIIV